MGKNIVIGLVTFLYTVFTYTNILVFCGVYTYNDWYVPLIGIWGLATIILLVTGVFYGHEFIKKNWNK